MYAVIDIETTGGSAQRERITEIAIYIYDGVQIIDSFVSLVNPERPIPYFITRLTGIADHMVADAPRFCEIARKVVEITENCVFVAHNVNFDYSFIREEFRRLGYDYRRPKLCTISLGRKLMPGHRSYSLGNICSEAGIVIDNRHRAAGDALATVKLLEMLLAINEQSGENRKIKISTLEHEWVRTMPEATGVYYFFNPQDQIIYIGKSLNIRDRINTHLLQCNTRRAIDMKNAIARIGCEETGSELVALLLESEEIKRHMPVYNRKQRRQMANYGLFSSINAEGYICLEIGKTQTAKIPVTTYPALQEARHHLFALVEKFRLCQKLCGLYQSPGACFHLSIRQCKGACIGLEPTRDYNNRATQAIESVGRSTESFFIIEPGRHIEEKAVIKVENGRYAGFGYFDPTATNGNPEALHDFITPHEDNRDVQQIIKSYLRQGKAEKVVRF